VCTLCFLFCALNNVKTKISILIMKFKVHGLGQSLSMKRRACDAAGARAVAARSSPSMCTPPQIQHASAESVLVGKLVKSHLDTCQPTGSQECLCDGGVMLAAAALAEGGNTGVTSATNTPSEFHFRPSLRH